MITIIICNSISVKYCYFHTLITKSLSNKQVIMIRVIKKHRITHSQDLSALDIKCKDRKSR